MIGQSSGETHEQASVDPAEQSAVPTPEQFFVVIPRLILQTLRNIHLLSYALYYL